MCYNIFSKNNISNLDNYYAKMALNLRPQIWDFRLYFINNNFVNTNTSKFCAMCSWMHDCNLKYNYLEMGIFFDFVKDMIKSLENSLQINVLFIKRSTLIIPLKIFLWNFHVAKSLFHYIRITRIKSVALTKFHMRENFDVPWKHVEEKKNILKCKRKRWK